MKTIRVQIQVASMNDEGHSIGEGSIFRVMNALAEIFDGGAAERRVLVTPEIDLDALSAEIIKSYTNHAGEELISIRTGCLQGVYGSNTGKNDPGLTLWCDSSLFPERFIDSEFDEVVNIEQLCNEYGELMEDVDGFSVAEAFEAIGIEGQSDNTYNYLGHNYEDPQPLCHADFTVYRSADEEKALVVIKFHCGGDVRGNYTDQVVYKFDSIEDQYSALSPRMELIDEEHVNELTQLKEDLWKLKGNERTQRIKAIKELIG